MYSLVPQKKLSRLRVKAGCVFYCFLRYFLWIKYNSRFARKVKGDFQSLREEFPYSVFSHSSPLYRNLSRTDMDLQAGKVTNLNIAAKKVAPVILEPGKIFSYWKLIGNPTRFQGYKKGMMLVNGKPRAAIGGGLCALSNLIYWMTLHTNLSVIERFRHSYDVFPDSNRTLPFGSGATCLYNYRDLMIKNESREPFLLLIWIDGGRLHGEWRSKNPPEDEYQVYQKEHWITGEGPGIYVRHNRIFRRHWKLNNNGHEGKILVDDVEITENHALMMYQPFITES